MKRIVERIYRVGEASITTRIITDDTVPNYWRVLGWAVVIELLGTTGIMIGILVAAVAKKHGWW